MLNGAVNKQERGDIVLIKTMLSLNYFERMETKRKYEETYNSVKLFKKIKIINKLKFNLLKKELKKGLIKVMDKQYEPLLVAILTDRDMNDTDRIYESLYVYIYIIFI